MCPFRCHSFGYITGAWRESKKKKLRRLTNGMRASRSRLISAAERNVLKMSASPHEKHRPSSITNFAPPECMWFWATNDPPSRR